MKVWRQGLSRILENPILSIATTITALFAILNNFIGSVGIPPDLLVTGIVAYTTIHWSLFIWGELKRKEKITNLDGTREEKIPLRTLWRNIGPSIAVLPVLVSLLVWTAIPLLNHLGHTNWTLCGSFTRNCNQRSCLLLVDAKGRRISDECFKTDDDSGYKYLTAPNWWTYQPQKVLVRCDDNTSEAIGLNRSFFDVKCEGRIDAQ